GSAAFPFKTITQALELAREIRFGCPATHVSPSSPHTITIHVAPGTYVGAYTAFHTPLSGDVPDRSQCSEPEAARRTAFRGGRHNHDPDDSPPGEVATFLRCASRIKRNDVLVERRHELRTGAWQHPLAARRCVGRRVAIAD